MQSSTRSSSATGRGIAALFDDDERKALFRKYVLFLGWLEILIFVICWFYQLGTDGYDRFGPVEIPFPWKTYFVVAFLAPVAITFLIGVVIVGFNRYVGKSERDAPQAGDRPDAAQAGTGTAAGKAAKVVGVVNWVQKLPYLALLLLLAAAIGIVYHLDVVMGLIGAVGEKTAKVVLISGAVLLGVISIFALILLLFHYQLRKRAMDYRYRTQVAERFGLVILDDNTVLNHSGQLLIKGKKWKHSVPMLTAEPSNGNTDQAAAEEPMETTPTTDHTTLHEP